ncbi:MAG: sensor histidine kinase [Mycobacteriaceae bacterium]
MRLRLVLSYLALVAIALALFTIPVAISSSNLLKSNLKQTALLEAQLFVPLVQRTDPAAAVAIEDRTRDFQNATDARVKLFRTDNGANNPQVSTAFSGRDPVAVWGYQQLLGADGVSVAVPVRATTTGTSGPVIAVVQVAVPSAGVDQQIHGIWTFRISIGLAVLGASALIALALAGTIVRPLRRLEAVARRLGSGDWSARAPTSGPKEIASLADTLNSSAATTEALLASQRSFVADASHQLRTPLTAIRLSIDNVLDSDIDPTTTRQLTRIDGEVDRMSRMVEGLLALARSESSSTATELVDPTQIVLERCEVWAPVLREKELTLETDRLDASSVRLTPGALEQILDNLIDNAIAASPPDTTVTVTVAAENTTVLLTVTDEGHGMTPEQQSRAFDRFWRARRPGTGSGLGLAIVRSLIERDGGTASLRTAPAGGLTVELRLPRVIATA